MYKTQHNTLGARTNTQQTHIHTTNTHTRNAHTHATHNTHTYRISKAASEVKVAAEHAAGVFLLAGKVAQLERVIDAQRQPFSKHHQRAREVRGAQCEELLERGQLPGVLCPQKRAKSVCIKNAQSQYVLKKHTKS